MKKLGFTTSTLATAVIFAAFTIPASACITSTWTKTSGNSFAQVITGRDCGGNLSVRMTGGFGDTGWFPMYKNGTSNFKAQWGDGQVLTDIDMKVNGNTMSANFVHRASGGQVTNSQGSYLLTGN